MGTEARHDDDAHKNDEKQQRGNLPGVNSLVNFAGVAAVVWGVWVAKDTLVSINENVAIANKSCPCSTTAVAALRGSVHGVLDALWLDQRPWLGLSTAEIVGDDIDQDQGGTFRFRVLNSGKTPAFNVRCFDPTSGCTPTPVASRSL